MTPAATGPLVITPLAEGDIGPLEAALRHDAVYAHIGGTPSAEAFARGLRAAIAGPQPAHGCEHWLNHTVRVPAALVPALAQPQPGGGAPGPGPLVVVGRLEATLHDGIAEVAFLFAPQAQGRGWATAGLHWLHGELARCGHRGDLWACTVPGNLRSQALLQRCGYAPVAVQAPPTDPPLLSWDAGDLVFRRAMPAE